MERRGSRLSRRDFVVGAGAASLLAGCGRPPGQTPPPPRVPRIGFLSLGALTTPGAAYAEAFLQGLRDHGYVEGENILIEWHTGLPSRDSLPDPATELVHLPADVIVVGSGVVAEVVRERTRQIPIVVTIGSDLVGAGLVASLARPGGNVTGLSQLSRGLTSKRLELLRDVLPGARRVAVLWNPTNSANALDWEELQGAATVLGLQLQSLPVRNHSEIGEAFVAVTRERPDALDVVADPLFGAGDPLILDLIATNPLPTMSAQSELVRAGGLMAYGPSGTAMYRRAAYYVDRILNGAKPADLPVEQPMTFDFVVNLKTAQALGITFPNEIMLQVTEVIP